MVARGGVELMTGTEGGGELTAATEGTARGADSAGVTSTKRPDNAVRRW